MPIGFQAFLVADLMEPMQYAYRASLAMRYFVPVIGAACLAIAALLVWSGPGLLRVVPLALLAIATVSFTKFTVSAEAETVRVERETARLDTEIDRFLRKFPAGYALCADMMAPERCAVLYAYNRYRGEKSRNRIPPPAVGDGRILYANACHSADPAVCFQKILDKLDGRMPALIIWHARFASFAGHPRRERPCVEMNDRSLTICYSRY